MKKVTISNVEQLREALEAVATISAVEAIVNDSTVRALRSYAKEEGYYFGKPLTKVTKTELISAILGSFDGVFEDEVEVIEPVKEGCELAQDLGEKFISGEVSGDELIKTLLYDSKRGRFDYDGFARGLVEVFCLEAEIPLNHKTGSITTTYSNKYSYDNLNAFLVNYIRNYGPEFKDFPLEYTKGSEKAEIVNHNFIELLECKSEAELKAYFMKCKNVLTLQEMITHHYGKLPEIDCTSVEVIAEWFSHELWLELSEFRLRREDELAEQSAM